MICFPKPILKEDLYIVKKAKISIIILSSERMSHKDDYHKGSAKNKISGGEPLGAWRQDELIG
jgi:hypothetical protein